MSRQNFVHLWVLKIGEMISQLGHTKNIKLKLLSIDNIMYRHIGLVVCDRVNCHVL